ncbi:hypothetical protein FACS189483_09150 [Spirochaetia bacterium]|nr:hypothetical protein FACS189483_09150 [Spirochaetia bacterium]
MFKRIVAVVALGLALSTAAVFADHPGGFGIGVQGGYGGGLGGGLTLKFSALPVYWTIDASSGWLGIAGDYYILDKDFFPGFGYYLGVGGFINLGLWNNAGFDFGGGVRGVAGLSWRPIPLLEVYAQFTPSLGIHIYTNGIGGIGFWPNWYGGGLGLRFWL